MFTLLILFFALAIVFSFLCSTWEAVLLSITPAYTQRQVKEGRPLGRQLEDMKRNIDRPLAAILTLNTIAHTVGAIGVGNQATLLFADSNPLITGLLIPALMTLAILVLSEIIPKTLGAVYWRELAPFTVRCLHWLIRMLAPLIWLSERITGLIKRGSSHHVLSRRDFLALTELGVDQGALGDDESRMIKQLLAFRQLQARDAMTPRTVLQTAASRASIEEFHASTPELRFSRIPLHAGDTDNIEGYVLKTEILTALLDGRGTQPLSTLRREMLAFNEKTAIGTVFEKMVDSGEHIALIVDEYGGVDGILTMEDVIETLLGLQITDETDETTDMRALARQLWAQRAQKLGLISPVAEPPDATDR